jgi:hypothetical protein
VYGFGQNITDISDPMHEILFEAIGQVFTVIDVGLAKWSLSMFLLRLESAQWHKMLI